jgi:pimeloyl-ACP methyl ester carboxylesterase
VRLRWIALVALGVIAAAVGLSALSHRIADERFQDALDPFYATPEGIESAEPGTLLRVESLTSVSIPGAVSYRILYRTERPDGSPAVAGGMVHLPVAPAPPDGRPVLAYAHGTVGQGRGCAPSRRREPIGPNAWIGQAIAGGFAVVMTDYAGLGTDGPNLYLVGEAEARDVAFSVEALAEVPGAAIGDRWAVMGHSQGGHAALWTGHLGPDLLPARELVGVAALAPAADLPLIIDRQWSTGVGWGVGAEVARSWPAAYPGLDIAPALTPLGRQWTDEVAEACLGEGLPAPAILALAAAELGLPYFDGNPLRDPAISEAAAAETPRPLPAGLPLLVAQGTADAVVTPAANAALQADWCAAGSDLTFIWAGGVGHIALLPTMAPTAVPWLLARFDGPPPPPSCSGPAPVQGDADLYPDLRGAVD